MIIFIFVFCSNFLAIKARSLVSIENQNSGIIRRHAATETKWPADFYAEADVPEGTNYDLEIDISYATDDGNDRLDCELDPDCINSSSSIIVSTHKTPITPEDDGCNRSESFQTVGCGSTWDLDKPSSSQKTITKTTYFSYTMPR